LAATAVMTIALRNCAATLVMIPVLQHVHRAKITVVHAVQAVACVAVMNVANAVQFHSGESGLKVE